MEHNRPKNEELKKLIEQLVISAFHMAKNFQTIEICCAGDYQQSELWYDELEKLFTTVVKIMEGIDVKPTLFFYPDLQEHLETVH